MSIEYYLGNLGLDKDHSNQSKKLRDIILSNKSETEIILELKQYILSQNELMPDAILIINRAIMTHYGSEYLGLGKDDFTLKADLYKQFIDKFPNTFSFKFLYADCCLLAGKTVDEFYPILKEGMLQDKENKNYPSTDLFDIIHNSNYSFDFDILLLDKYYQPCDKETFDEWIMEFKKQYSEYNEQRIIENLKWRGEIAGTYTQNGV